MKIIILLLCCVVLSYTIENRSKRVKRKVLFIKNSKMFFRLNGKDNVLPWTQIFAHGWAFRVNWELPDTLPKRRKIFKRDVHSEIPELLNRFSLEGYSCIMQYICANVKKIRDNYSCGIFCEIGRIISQSSGIEAIFFNSFLDRCTDLEESCPYVPSTWNRIAEY